MIKSTIFHVPVSVATTPVDGECYVNRWWMSHPNKGIAFYIGPNCTDPSPQCHRSKSAVERVYGFPDHVPLQLPVVFATHALREVRRIQKEQRYGPDKPK